MKKRCYRCNKILSIDSFKTLYANYYSDSCISCREYIPLKSRKDIVLYYRKKLGLDHIPIDEFKSIVYKDLRKYWIEWLLRGFSLHFKPFIVLENDIVTVTKRDTAIGYPLIIEKNDFRAITYSYRETYLFLEESEYYIQYAKQYRHTLHGFKIKEYR